MLPAKPFYLIRHGQSEANAAHITAGGLYDSPLNATGRAQAAALAPFMPSLALPPTAIYHSDLSRARDTARTLNGSLGLPMKERHDLREHDMGDWDGQPWHLVEPLLTTNVPPPNGETESRFARRIQSALTDVVNECAGLPLVVAHGGLFHAVGFLYDYAMDQVGNCQLHYFEPNTAWKKFPWRAWRFDIEGGALVKNPAPFCLSHVMEKPGAA